MTLNLPKLEKVWALATSPVAGEAHAALHRAHLMVEAVGKTLDDVPELLSGMRGVSGHFARQRPFWYTAKHEASLGPWTERHRRCNEGVMRYGQPDVMSAAETGRFVRVHLKRWFPGVKFRIRTGDAFLVEWTGMPAQADVERLLTQFAPGRAWRWDNKTTRAPLADMERMESAERVWADPTSPPNPAASLKWFDHFGITCLQHEDQVPIEVELAPPPPEPVSKAPWYSVQLPLNFA